MVILVFRDWKLTVFPEYQARSGGGGRSHLFSSYDPKHLCRRTRNPTKCGGERDESIRRAEITTNRTVHIEGGENAGRAAEARKEVFLRRVGQGVVASMVMRFP